MNRQRKRLARTAALGVILPVNDEEALLGGALTALEAALDEMTDAIS